jgi:hypothetical protein
MGKPAAVVVSSGALPGTGLQKKVLAKEGDCYREDRL